MNRVTLHISGRTRAAGWAILLLGLLAPAAARADSFDANFDFRFWDLDSMPQVMELPASAPAISRAQRVHLFRMAPSFINDPLGLQEEEMALPGVTSLSTANAPPPPTNGPEWIQFGIGVDNPNFDLRRPGDPGGVGYYRVNTQVQLFETSTTAFALDLQAVAPAGIQFAGMPNGATVLSPAFSVFHTLTENTAIQGFVAKNVPVSGADNSTFLQRSVQYGMAVQRPLVAEGPEALRNVYLSVGALGKLRSDRDGISLLPTYDVLPGVQWHVNDNWWLSSGVLVPVGPTRTAPSQWQLTCSLQF